MNDSQTYRWPHMTLGVCYYPEHWPESMWADDLARMAEAGVQVVRVAEFAWSVFEPREGRFSFDLFDRFLDLAHRAGLRVIFGTPTAAPPAWLTERYPEVLNARRDGVLYRHGGRRHYNYNSPTYRTLAGRIVEELARHYGPHPAIVGWQIDNELNCEIGEFYSQADDDAFRAFLREKYGTLDALNAAWGGAFWSHAYSDWSQVHLPRTLVGPQDDPHQLLDYRRFISRSVLDFCGLQTDILRRYIPRGVFLTTNGRFGPIDNHQMAREHLDCYTYDSYPAFALGLDADPLRSADLNDRRWSYNLNETRSICPHFGIMEQLSGAIGSAHAMEGPAPRPGQLTLWAMQSVAHGADFISFFRWRTAPFGNELYWHGILDYDSRDNRKLAEVKAFARLFRALEPLCGSGYVTSFAVVKDYDNEWDADCDAWHQRLRRQSDGEIFVASELTHSPCDVLYLRDDTPPDQLRRYPVLLYPHPLIVTQPRADLLRAYVEDGGTLILGCRAGLKDQFGHCVTLPQPGLFQPLTGTDVRDFTFQSPTEPPVWADWEGERLDTPLFHDILTPLPGARVLARYAASYYAGEAALTERPLGKGRVLHLGSAFSRENMKQLLAYTGALEPFRDLLDAPPELEVVVREKEGRRWLFLLNFLPTPLSYTLKLGAPDLLTGRVLAAGGQTLPPYGVAVLGPLEVTV